MRQIQNYACHCLGLKSYFQQPGDGRAHPHIPASDLVWAVVIGRILRVTSFLRLEWLVHSPARAGLGVKAPFGDDVLAYCTERMDPETTRLALAAALHQAKRNKAFENSRFIGLALDGTGAGRTYKEPCPLCDPIKDAKGEVHGSLHHFVLISVVGTGLTLPIDVEPYGPGDSEYAAAQRLLRRAVDHLGPRFADYVVGDGAYATAPFCTPPRRSDCRWWHASRRTFPCWPPPYALASTASRPMLCSRKATTESRSGTPMTSLLGKPSTGPPCASLRYRQHKRDGTVVQAEWLTNFSIAKLGSLSFYRMAKSRWEIENRRLQRWQEPLWHGAYLSPRAQQHPDRLAADRAGLGHRTPLPAALSAPWRPWRSLRHGIV